MNGGVMCGSTFSALRLPGYYCSPIIATDITKCSRPRDLCDMPHRHETLVHLLSAEDLSGRKTYPRNIVQVRARTHHLTAFPAPRQYAHGHRECITRHAEIGYIR